MKQNKIDWTNPEEVKEYKRQKGKEAYNSLSSAEKSKRGRRNNIKGRKSKAKWYIQNQERILDKTNKQYQERREQIIEQLGGVCSHLGCNCTENLQFDHINPLKKSFNISERLSSWDIKKLQPEIKKCQLLCPEHHAQKTKEDAKKYGYHNGNVTDL